MKDLLVSHATISVADGVAKDAELADDLLLLHWHPRPHYVVLGLGWVNPVHEYVSVPFWRVLDAFEERSYLFSVFIVAASLTLWLQHIFLWILDSSVECLVTFLTLKIINSKFINLYIFKRE